MVIFLIWLAAWAAGWRHGAIRVHIGLAGSPKVIVSAEKFDEEPESDSSKKYSSEPKRTGAWLPVRHPRQGHSTVAYNPRRDGTVPVHTGIFLDLISVDAWAL
jgi:hypothetical protein